MEIKLDAEAAASIASAAIFNSLSEDYRNEVIKQAVQHLIAPSAPSSGSSYRPGPSPIQQAFERALTTAAYTAVEEKVKTDPTIQAEIEKLLGPLINGVLEEESARYNNELSDRIGKALGDWIAEVSRNRSSY